MRAPIITLTTDFGLRDPYVAEMKAVILNICPTASIVDVSHELDKFDIRMGAYVLACASPFFPKGTIHVAVVDPGVGTRRAPLLITTKTAFFVGPDNGITSLAAKQQGIKRIHKITNPRVMLQEVSDTFHGRDIFAPAAAHLANGMQPSEFGPEKHKIMEPAWAKATRKKELVTGEVLHIDGFGNVITSIEKKNIKTITTPENAITVDIGKARLKLHLRKAYAEAQKQELLAIIGSHGFLEIAVNQGNAAREYGIERNDKVTLHFSPKT